MIAFPLLSAAAMAETHPGQEQLVREVAKDTGKSRASLNALLDGAKKQQAILDAISRPADGKPWRDSRPIFLTEQRIAAGADFRPGFERLRLREESLIDAEPRETVAKPRISLVTFSVISALPSTTGWRCGRPVSVTGSAPATVTATVAARARSSVWLGALTTTRTRPSSRSIPAFSGTRGP